MEALIIIVLALVAIILIEAGYGIAIGLARWSPVIAIGVLAGWFAHDLGAAPLEALGPAILACLVARHVLRSRRPRN